MRFTFNRRKACGISERRRSVPAAALGLAAALASLPAAAAWDAKYYNPQPQKGDVILPMPCGGAMAWRQIRVPMASPLDDYAVTLGQDSEEWGYLEQARPTHIAGSFSVGKPEPGRYYLLAKYEVSELQYRAVMDGQCPEPSAQLRLPQTGVSWFDAIAFTDRYNLWLRQNAADKLPKEDGVAGFLRLPTEVEWEFAARGGLAVSQAEFRDVRFPMPEGLNAYAWFAGAQSANGQLQLAGLLKPNPLGLHDMLGNVDEMLFEPFHLNKLDRQHGQAGGYILRGGNYLTPQAELRTALRQEQPYYAADGSAQNRLKTGGFRPALVAPALTSRERIKQVESDWKKLGVSRPEAPAESGARPAAEDPATRIASLAEGVQDDALRQQLEKLRSELRANTQARDEQRDQAIRSELQLGAFLCTKLKDDGLFLDTLEGNYSRSCGAGGSEPKARCEARREQLDGHRKVLDFMLNYYADSVVGTALNYSQASVEPQVDLVAQQLAARGKSNLRSYLDTHWNNLRTYLKNGKVARAHWLQSCKTL